MAAKKSLGKGLANIYGDELYNVIDEIEKTGIAHQLSISKIRPNPYQPRKYFDTQGLQELAKSIEMHGMFTPILVRESMGGYELIAGERRLRAAKICELAEVPAIIVEFDDKQMLEISLLENIQREDLNAIEEAQAYQKMIELLGYTQESLGERVNKSRAHVTNMLRLLKLPKAVQDLVSDGKLSMGHVRPLITMAQPNEMVSIANKAIEEGLSVRQVENLVKQPVVASPKKVVTTDYSYASELLTKKLQTKVKVVNKQVIISFYDDQDLNRLLEVMDCLEE